MPPARPAAAALLLLALGAGCAPQQTPAPAAPASSAPAAPASATPSAASSPSSGETAPADTLTIEISIAGGKVTPNGQKIDATVGQQVVLKVTSDVADELHAHIGGDGYEMEVKPGTTTTGSFTLSSPGSFEVELHELSKTVVILNAR